MPSGRRCVFGAGETILAEGQTGTDIYILESGRCAVTVRGEHVGTIEPGELFGEIAGLEAGMRTATVTALDPCTVTTYTADDIRSRLERDPLFLRTAMRNILLRTGSMAARERDIRWEQQRLERMQLALLPDLAAFNENHRCRLEALRKPFTHAGGDYYDALWVEPDRLLVVLGDAEGHGAMASLVMAIVRAQLHHVARQFQDPAELLGALDRYLCNCGPPGQFMTLVAMMIDFTSGAARFANAGENAPLIAGTDGVRDGLVDVGLPLGQGHLTNRPYQTATATVHPGDSVLFVTDGVLGDAETGVLGRDDLQRLFVDQLRDRSAGMTTRMFDEILRRRNVTRLADDATVLLVTVKEPGQG